MGLAQEVNINDVLNEELFQFQLPATNTTSVPAGQPQCFSRIALDRAAMLQE
jgi:hypothetical protein